MQAPALEKAFYDPSCFLNVETVEEARDIIVTPFDKLPPQHRWDTETPYLVGLIERWITPKSLVLDYGCGIGRLAKPLIEKQGCEVIGVDISPNMRALATSRVNSDRFVALPPELFWRLNGHLWACNFALAVWTLQHVLKLPEAVRDIEAALAPGGKLFVVNDAKVRYIPITNGWIDDGVDVRAVLQDQFTELEHGQLEGDDIAPGSFKDSNFWAVYQK
jgi:SAM-dependent methyltransferase